MEHEIKFANQLNRCLAFKLLSLWDWRKGLVFPRACEGHIHGIRNVVVTSRSWKVPQPVFLSMWGRGWGYTGGSPQRLDTHVHGIVTAKMSTALWQRKKTQRRGSDGALWKKWWWQCWDNDAHIIKPGAHESKQLSKKSREVVSSAVSSGVCVNFGEIFASRGRETSIYRVW